MNERQVMACPPGLPASFAYQAYFKSDSSLAPSDPKCGCVWRGERPFFSLGPALPQKPKVWVGRARDFAVPRQASRCAALEGGASWEWTRRGDCSLRMAAAMYMGSRGAVTKFQS